MKIKSIQTEIEYQNALAYLENLGDNPELEHNPELQKEFDALEKSIELYDKEHYFIEKGNPIEIIKLKMNYMGLKQKDLISAVGNKGSVSEVLNKKRKLSKKMIRELSILLDINQETLNTDYELDTSKSVLAELNPFPYISSELSSRIENFSNVVFSRGTILSI